jgi:hypothetical protein
MTGAAKRKGDIAEREAAELLAVLLGVPARRKLGAGRLDDEGDIDGVPETAVQVVSRSSDVVAVGVVRKPLEADAQAVNGGLAHSVVMLRVRGGTWRFVMTPAAFKKLWLRAVKP